MEHPAREPALLGEAELSAYVEVASAARPEVAFDAAEFVRHLVKRTQDGKLPPLAHAADLWLACACAAGIPAAIEAFQREYAPVIARVLARREASADVADDVRQQLVERLLVADHAAGRPAKIADYQGRGPLKSWVATATATTLLALRRASGRRREVPEQLAGGSSSGLADPELELIKRRYAPEVAAAVLRASLRRRALAALHSPSAAARLAPIEARRSLAVLGFDELERILPGHSLAADSFRLIWPIDSPVEPFRRSLAGHLRKRALKG